MESRIPTVEEAEGLAGAGPDSRPTGPGGRRTSAAPHTRTWWPRTFVQQFGPGRPKIIRNNSPVMVPQILCFLYISSCFTIAECCSSRSTPKAARGPGALSGMGPLRPNVTFQTYSCPEAYARWYCLNGATCFALKIRDSILYNCECADGYMGQRCEFKDLDGSYLPSREREIQRAGVAGGLLLLTSIPACFYLIFSLTRHYRTRLSRPSFGVCCPDAEARLTLLPSLATRPHLKILEGKKGGLLPLFLPYSHIGAPPFRTPPPYPGHPTPPQ